MINLPRRKFITSALCLIAAPTIVRAANIMPVRVVEDRWEIIRFDDLVVRGSYDGVAWFVVEQPYLGGHACKLPYIEITIPHPCAPL
jgi:hypothetical protein